MKHVAYVEIDIASVLRGGSCRNARCICDWKGPERSSLELAVDDALLHENSDHQIVKRPFVPWDGLQTRDVQ